MAKLKIAVGCDPNAASAKAALMQYLGQKGFLLTDFGSDDPIYANVAIKVAEAVSRKEYDRGILICGTGLGVSIAANKVKGAYAALTPMCTPPTCQEEQQCNIACFGAFTIGIRLMERLAETFLSSEFTPGCASQPKIDRIAAYER